MQLILHATLRCLTALRPWSKLCMSARYKPDARSPPCRDTRVYGYATTAMQDMSTPHPAHPPPVSLGLTRGECDVSVKRRTRPRLPAAASSLMGHARSVVSRYPATLARHARRVLYQKLLLVGSHAWTVRTCTFKVGFALGGSDRRYDKPLGRPSASPPVRRP